MDAQRYDKMLTITGDVKKYISDFFEQDEHIYEQKYKTPFLLLYNQRFAKNIWLRPFITASVYQFFSQQSYVTIIPALAASEVFNVSTYQSNLIFDKKINEQNALSEINQFISSFISFNIVNKMLDRCPIESFEKVKCINLLAENNEQVYSGQYIDLNILIAANARDILDKSYDEYLSLYLERCDLIGGTTVENCAFWGTILSQQHDEDIIKETRQLFRQWGKLMQMVNDLADFTIFIDDKRYIRYTDIRAGKITLPFYLILKEILDEQGLEDTLDLIAKLHNGPKQQLDRFFSTYLYVDSPIIKQVFNLFVTEWDKCNNHLQNLKFGKEFSYLFENVFLNKFVRVFFSNNLLKRMK